MNFEAAADEPCVGLAERSSLLLTPGGTAADRGRDGGRTRESVYTVPIIEFCGASGTCDSLDPMAAIPPHNLNGVLPPFVGTDVASAAAHSPYRAQLSEVVDRFASSRRRIEILQGFLALRRELKALGVSNGIQWLDGSFIEQIAKEPNDIDIITIFEPPTTWSNPAVRALAASRRDLFDVMESKKKYHCDAYYLDARVINIRMLTYWYGLFGHRRTTFEWKGLVEVDLTEDEQAAEDLLAQKAIP